MRIDLFSIFPEYFAPLRLSLLGKAENEGLLSVKVHDLRKWTHDRHRSVDDTPYGGGAGMVMMPRVWGEALDECLADSSAPTGRTVLAIPTPSGEVLTQARCADLATASRILVACGRYEGIDQRVADHYRTREIEVVEYSIGDYVLNGGEAAALVLVEAVARLLDGFMGNPESIVEESHSDGLLEYPAYTKPRQWRNLEVPQVLLSGDHARIGRWRRDRSLERTAHRRPDLLSTLDPHSLDSADHTILAQAGYLLTEGGVHRMSLRTAVLEDAHELAELAQRTFPDACPSRLPQEAINAFMSEELSVDKFTQYLLDPKCQILLAEVEGTLGGYTLVLTGEDAIDPQMYRKGTIECGDAYLSKCYVDSHWRGTGLAGALLEASVYDTAVSTACPKIILGTNEGNTRARRFYRRHGFAVRATRTFFVGGIPNRDVVFVRDLTSVRADS